MGVYVNTYHCRVGMFVPGDGFGFMSLCITFSRVVKLLGSLNLVRILLLIAGVEQNPGPEKYIFRYQYLLVEIGTDILRKIFDVQVGSDFVRHLSANNNKFNRILQRLISVKIITTDQAQYLPPIDNSPQTINMDITLLTCLLRNVCGLCSQNDPVWKNPQPTDLSLEAELARFKECRNKLQHSGTVFISEADLTAMWNELSEILNRLNTVSKIPDLSSLINDAKKMDIDEELKKRYDQAIEAWTEMDILLDRGIEELKLGQSEIKDGQSEISQRQIAIKDGQSAIIKGQSEIKHHQSEIKDGQSAIKDSQSAISHGQSAITHGQSEIKYGQSEIKDGQSEIKDCQSEIKHGQSAIIQDQSEIKHLQSEIKDGQSAIKDGQSEIKDGQSAIIQGQSEIKHHQSEIKDGQSEINDGQSAIKDGQSEIKDGLSAIKDGQSEIIQDQFKIKDGQSEIKDGQSEIKDGQSEIIQGQSNLNVGQTELKDGQAVLRTGQSEIKDGQSEIVQGVSNLNIGQCDIQKSLSEIKLDLLELKQGQSELKSRPDLRSQENGVRRQSQKEQVTKRVSEPTPLGCKGRRLDMDESVPGQRSLVQATAHSDVSADTGAAAEYTRQFNSIIQLLKQSDGPVLARDVAKLTGIGEAAKAVNGLLYHLEKKGVISKIGGAKPLWSINQDKSVSEDDMKIFGIEYDKKHPSKNK